MSKSILILFILLPLVQRAQTSQEQRERDSLAIIKLTQKLEVQIKEKDLVKAMQSLDTIFMLAQINNFIKKTGDCYFNLSIISKIEGDTSKLLVNLAKSIEYYLADQAWSSAAKAHTAIAQTYLSLENAALAEDNFLVSLDLRKRIQDSLGMANNLFNLGSLSYQSGAYSAATGYYHQALQISNNIRNKNLSASILINLSNVHSKLRNYDQSIGLLQQALDIYRETGDKKGESNTLMSIGIYFYEKGSHKEAKSFLNQALTIKKTIKGDEPGIGKTYNNLGLVAKAEGDTALANQYYEQALIYARKTKDSYLEATIINNIGSGKLGQNETESLDLLMQSLAKAKELGLKRLILANYINLQDYFARKGNYKKAFEYAKLAQDLNQEMLNEQVAQKVIELQTQYDAEKKQAEIELLQKEAQIQALSLSRNRMFTYAGIGFSIMLLIIITILYSRYLLKQQTNKQLKELNHTKDRFFTIIAHDLKNTLSAFKNISGSLRKKLLLLSPSQVEMLIESLDESAKSLNELFQNLLQWSQSQTGSIKLNPSVIYVEDFIKSLLTSLEQEREIKQIEIKTNIENGLNVISDANILATVTRNLLTNSIKFSPQGSAIEISVTKQNSKVLFSIKDQGSGISKEDLGKLFRIEEDAKRIGNHENKGSGLGLIISKELIERAGGNIGAESEIGSGSNFYFLIPQKTQS